MDARLLNLYTQTREFHYFNYPLDQARTKLVATADSSVLAVTRRFSEVVRSTKELTDVARIICVATQRLMDYGTSFSVAFTWAVDHLYANQARVNIMINGVPNERLMFKFTLTEPTPPQLGEFDSMFSNFFRDFNNKTIFKAFMDETVEAAARLMCLNLNNKTLLMQETTACATLFRQLAAHQRQVSKAQLARFFREFNFNPNHIDAANASFYTPLTWAVKLKDLAVCKMLVDAGADVNAANGCGNTPLHIAVDYLTGVNDGDAKAIITFLLQQNAVPNALNHQRKTPFAIADEKRQAGIFALFMLERQEFARVYGVETIAPTWRVTEHSTSTSHSTSGFRVGGTSLRF